MNHWWLLYSRWFTNVKGSTSKDKRVIKRQLYSGLWEKYPYLSTMIVRTQCSASLPVFCTEVHWMQTLTLALLNWSHAPCKTNKTRPLVCVAKFYVRTYWGKNDVHIYSTMFHSLLVHVCWSSPSFYMVWCCRPVGLDSDDLVQILLPTCLYIGSGAPHPPAGQFTTVGWDTTTVVNLNISLVSCNGIGLSLAPNV